jgi:hypothetical protein
MAVGEWSDEENAAIVADYFGMLALELAGELFSKAERNRALQSLTGRGRGSIEYKHQNISAILKGLGETSIDGYKPAFNYQRSLETAVLDWLNTHPDWLVRPPARSSDIDVGLYEPPSLWIGPAPTLSNHPDPTELAQTMAIARRYDVAERDERNRVLGRRGEELVVRHERHTLAQSGRSDLAERVRWVSDVDGDGAGFDIASFLPDGRERLIEVKTTNGWERTPFHISGNELAVSEQRRSDWCLLRLWNFSREPKAFELYPPLESHVALTPTSFLATLR